MYLRNGNKLAAERLVVREDVLIVVIRSLFQRIDRPSKEVIPAGRADELQDVHQLGGPPSRLHARIQRLENLESDLKSRLIHSTSSPKTAVLSLLFKFGAARYSPFLVADEFRKQKREGTLIDLNRNYEP